MPKKAAILAKGNTYYGGPAKEEARVDDEKTLSFIRKNPLLRSTVSSARGKYYGGVPHLEVVEAEDLSEILQRSDMPDIIQKLLKRERSIDTKLAGVLVSSLHDKEHALQEQLYLRLTGDRISKQPNASLA